MSHDDDRPGGWEWLSRHANIIEVVSFIGAVVPIVITIIGSLPVLLVVALVGMFGGAFFLALIAKTVTARSEPAMTLGLGGGPKSLPDGAQAQGALSGGGEGRTNIVCFKPRLVRLVQQEWVFRHAHDVPQLEGHGHSAYVIEVENEPVKGRRLDAVNDVQAQLLFYNPAGREYGRVEQGAWVGWRGGQVNLEVGVRRELVLAIWWERDGEQRVMGVGSSKEQGLPLKHDWLRVHLRLLSGGEILMNRDYKLIIKSGGALPFIEMLAVD